MVLSWVAGNKQGAGAAPVVNVNLHVLEPIGVVAHAAVLVEYVAEVAPVIAFGIAGHQHVPVLGE
jgi:hypothetical protein